RGRCGTRSSTGAWATPGSRAARPRPRPRLRRRARAWRAPRRAAASSRAPAEPPLELGPRHEREAPAAVAGRVRVVEARRLEIGERRLLPGLEHERAAVVEAEQHDPVGAEQDGAAAVDRDEPAAAPHFSLPASIRISPDRSSP